MNDDNKSDTPLPAKLEQAKLEPAKPGQIGPATPGVALNFAPDGSLVLTPVGTKKADDKKKMPRGSAAFRHA